VLLAALVRTQMVARRRADREVFERTAELREAALELGRVNTELETHSREVEAFAQLQRDFVATASHELRTPLTSILGYLELVLGSAPEELPDEPRAHVQIAYRSSQRLLAIVGDLLTVDKVDAGAMEIDPQDVTLEELVAPTLLTFGPACERKGLRLVVDADAAPRASTPTAIAWTRSSATSSATRSSSRPRARSASRCAPPGGAPSCGSPTPGPGSPPTSCP